mgnify:CR=1 FL=1
MWLPFLGGRVLTRLYFLWKGLREAVLLEEKGLGPPYVRGIEGFA